MTLRDGIRVSPDSWAYWQGSVQLLENSQYRYFFQHQPIRSWPPGYSLYLASWQSWLGVSGKTLVIANITLITLVAGLWTCLSLVILAPILRRCHKHTPIVIAVYLALFFTFNLKIALATNLLYVLFPIFLLLAVKTLTCQRRWPFYWLTIATGTTGAMMLLAHNSALAIVPIGSYLMLTHKTIKKPDRVIAGFFIGIIAIVPWYAVRTYLEQGGSHPVGFGTGRYPFYTYLWQLLHGLPDGIASHPGIIIFPGLAFLLFRFTKHVLANEGTELRDAILRIYSIVTIATALLFLMFNLTYIADDLGERFNLFQMALLVPLIFTAWGFHLNPENESSITNKHLIRHLKICLIIVLAVSIQRVGKQVWDTQFDTSQLDTPSETFVHTSFTITTSFNDKTPVKKGKLLHITPPVFHWQRLSQ